MQSMTTTTEIQMTLSAAQALAAKLTARSATCRATVQDTQHGPRIVFTGSPTGEHSLSIWGSSEERILAHWEGYTGRPAAVSVGSRVLFTRGMFGTWRGTVKHVGHRRTSYGARPVCYLVSFTRRNGTAGTLRCSEAAIRQVLR